MNKHVHTKVGMKSSILAQLGINFSEQMQREHWHAQVKGCSEEVAFDDHRVKSGERKPFLLEL